MSKVNSTLSFAEKISIIRSFTPNFVGKSDEEIRSYWGATSRMADEATRIVNQVSQRKLQFDNYSQLAL